MERHMHCQPLRSRTGEPTFRLLTLEPGGDDQPIVCSIQVLKMPNPHTLEAVVPYEALSYAWGAVEPQYEITIGAWPVMVRKNLWSFLAARRHRTQPVVIWIDALCIDQSNLSERASQVQCMDTIYKASQRVFVWLGSEEADGPAVNSLLGKMSGSSSHITTLSRSDSEYEALLAWSSREYWTRTWVVQEFLLAKNIILGWGRYRIEWSSIKRALQHVESLSRKDEHLWSTFLQTAAFELMQQRANEIGNEVSLDALLARNQRTRCHDPRDKIFAMLGLAAPSKHGYRISVSYTKDVRKLMWDVVEYCQRPAKEIPSFVNFLMGVLQHRPESTPIDFPPSLMSTRWTLPIFRGGRVVRCDILQEGSTSADSRESAPASGLLRSQSIQVMPPAAPPIFDGFESLPRAATMVVGSSPYLLDLELEAQLRNQYRLLNDICTRTGGSRLSQTSEYVPHTSGRLYRVTVLTSNCVKKELITGVAYGEVRRGDFVSYFFGHEIGFTSRADTTDADHIRLTGRILCLNNGCHYPRADAAISQDSAFWTIHNETELTGFDETTELQMTSQEVYQLSS